MPSKPPFTYTGVDCFGPFQVCRGRTKVKRHGVIFTCLTLRAVHIEAASSLDTESFISALRRFIARRGQPEEIRSDNSGNFVRGERELREAINEWNQSQVHDFFSNGISSGHSTHQPALTMAEYGRGVYGWCARS